MGLPYSPVLKGTGGQATIVQANIAQALKSEMTFVRSITIIPDSANSGEMRMSYGGVEPLMPQLYLDAGRGRMVDLSLIYIKSTVAGDKANYNVIYSD